MQTATLSIYDHGKYFHILIALTLQSEYACAEQTSIALRYTSLSTQGKLNLPLSKGRSCICAILDVRHSVRSD
jgi:hypothetical protein